MAAPAPPTLTPISASTLLDLELSRRQSILLAGPLSTGCAELDDSLLLGGGFERGCVVGVSADEEGDDGEAGGGGGGGNGGRNGGKTEGQFGLVLGLQTLARYLLMDGGGEGKGRAMVVTTMSVSELLPVLRGVLVAQAEHLSSSQKGNPSPQLDPTWRAKIKSCLSRIAISRVFDMEGLWEVIRELSSSSNTPTNENENAGNENNAKTPDLILITHLTPLIKSLFASGAHDRREAHSNLQLLGAQLRHLSRSSSSSSSSSGQQRPGPLIILLNSLNPHDTSSTPTSRHHQHQQQQQQRRRDENLPIVVPPPEESATSSTALDPTLRSIFLPAAAAAGASDAGRRNKKPAFGLSFAQLVDVHLLCTRVPRTRADAEAVFTRGVGYGGGGGGDGGGGPSAGLKARYAWVVECLLDEVGVWEEGSAEGRERRSREQRWGAVDVQGGVKIVDAFTS